jgi:hypothetical protein
LAVGIGSVVEHWSTTFQASAFLLPLPAGLDFCAHEASRWKSNNAIRIASGILLGLLVGRGLSWAICGHLLWGALVVLWLAAIEIVVALVLRAAGTLDTFLARYEKATAGSRATGETAPASSADSPLRPALDSHGCDPRHTRRGQCAPTAEFRVDCVPNWIDSYIDRKRPKVQRGGNRGLNDEVRRPHDAAYQLAVPRRSESIGGTPRASS